MGNLKDLTKKIIGDIEKFDGKIGGKFKKFEEKGKDRQQVAKMGNWRNLTKK